VDERYISNDVIKALDFLDQEATEDEAFRSNHPITAVNYAEDYPPSCHRRLTNQGQTCRASLEQASVGKQEVLDRIDEHDDDNINLLSLGHVRILCQPKALSDCEPLTIRNH
jgi:hypothetical protein